MFARPFIPLTLRHQEKTVTALALVDSEADFYLFDGQLTSFLDLDLASLEKIEVGGVSGTAEEYVAHLEMGVADIFFSAPMVFSFAFSLRSRFASTRSLWKEHSGRSPFGLNTMRSRREVVASPSVALQGNV